MSGSFESEPAPRGASAGHESRGVGFAPIDAALAGKIPPPSQPVEFYKKHSLAALNWGAIGESGQQLRHLTREEAQATVLRGLLATPLETSGRSPREWVVAVVIHVVLIAGLVLVPLAFLEKLDSTNLQTTYLTMPRPPSPPPPPPSAPDLPVRHTVLHFHAATITMPTVIPKRIVEIKDEAAPEVDASGAVGGTPGGENGGVLGGVLGGTQGGSGLPPPPPPAAKSKTVHRVGGDVRPPRQVVKVDPVYPTIARTARVEGDVLIDAVLDEKGNVIQARAVSGPALLIPAALKTVLQWKYEPTYLDGEPVSISMEVTVSFHMH
jgi:periplasmic protein TonB